VDCEFNNCIMFGNNAFLSDFSEFIVDVDDTAPVDYIFRHCLVDTDQNVDDGDHFADMKNGQGPNLCDPANGNFHISQNNSLMQGVDSGLENPPLFDIEGNNWNPLMEGCYTLDGNNDGDPCN
jgi:hypothetical protein